MKKMLLIFLFVAVPLFVHADATTTPLEATTTPPTATSTPIVATSTPDTATITIRENDVVAFSGAIVLPATTSPQIHIAPTGSTSTVAVDARSVLAILEALDASSTDFDISNVQYFSSFNSFLINCITIPAASTTPFCNDWQYVVNGTAPFVGVDQMKLSNNDSVILYFGFPRQVSLAASTVTASTSFAARAQIYNPANNTFSPATGVTIGVTQSDPNNPFSPREIATSSVDVNGQAIFALSATGTYQVGIKEDFYFPAVALTVVAASTSPVTSTPAAPTNPPVSNGPPASGGSGGITHVQLNIANALAYLVSKQHPDGSFDSPLLSDWAAITFAAADPGAAKTSLRNYLLTASPALSSATDYERHTMALQGLGIDPYSGTPTDYIAQVVAKFDGTQIGDASLDNDDIFAIYPLLHAGYTSSDDLIQKTAAFIVSRQQASGSWDGSVDVTAAAIQALSLVHSLPNVSAVIGKAENYLHAQQQSNGGWGNSFSTSWALQAIQGLGESASTWIVGGYNPNDYLANLQQSDGGVEPISSDTQTRQWATEYAIPASLGKTWNSILQSFSKPAGTAGGGGTTLGASTSTVSAATSIVATSTTPTTTSTPPALPYMEVPATTPTVLGVSSTTVITETLSAPKPVMKKAVAIKKPLPPQLAITSSTSIQVPTSAQTAAAASVSENFLGKLWHAITTFFAWLF